MDKRTCSVDGCEQGGRIKAGLCNRHYQRMRTHGSTDLPKREYRSCAGPKCERRAGTSGLCPSHYKQWHLGKSLAPLRVATKDLGRPTTCSVAGCDRPHKARGMCKTHNEHMDKYGEIRRVQRRNPGQPCRIEKCTGVAAAHSLCGRHVHYAQTARRYGLTADEYLDLQEARGGCDICGEPNRAGTMLAVDHDHACCSGAKTCGKCVRGLLCDRCNQALGQMRDDPERLRKAAAYLESR